MTTLTTAAPAKVNLGLFLGPPRERDGMHELITVMQSVSLADTVTLCSASPGSTHDEVICPGLPGPAEENLAARALAAFRRASGWQEPPLRLQIDKRIPLAAGLAGGSADAAATLRLAHEASGLGERATLLALAAELGADVSAQLQPGRWLASGAGERLAPLRAPRASLELLLVPFSEGLSTAEVYAEADRLGLARAPSELRELERRLHEQLAGGSPLAPDASLLANDLQPAAISLCPAIEETLAQVLAAGAPLAFVSGSGPTVVGAFSGPRARAELRRACERLGGRIPAPIACKATGADAGSVGTLA